MSPEKFIKYSVPFFVLAIISRSIEEISFFYYAVPVLCVFFILIGIWLFKNDKRRKESNPSFWRSPESEEASDSDSQLTSFTGMTDSKQVGMTDNSASSFWRSPESEEASDSDSRQAGRTDSEQVGMTDSEQVGMTGSKIGNQHPSPLMLRRTGLPSPIIHQPYFLFILPGIWFLMTSLWSSYPEVSATRALYFILISTGCISAGILWIRFSNKNIFDFLLPANVIVVLICLFSLITNIPSDSWTAGHGKGFIGFFGHQNLLASIILFTIPTVFGFKIKDQSKKIKGRKVFFFILFSLNLLVLALTYSRSAILALIFGVIVFLILNKNWKILSYSFVAAAVITSIIYLTPAMNNFADKILKKDFPEVYSSRLWMWEPSYNAALEGGLFGLGYGISHPEIRSGEYSDRFENGRLIREKGNSALALVEESGLIGLILFILPIIYLLIKLPDTRPCLPAGRYQKPDKDYKSGIRNPESPSSPPYGGFAEASSIQNLVSSILIASLAAFILHAQFEAWWVGVGSVQLPLFFVYIGLTIHLASVNEIKA